MRAWACHAGIGAKVHPADAPIELGTTLLVVLPVGPMAVFVPNRIVVVVDEPQRFGFAYGTLEGHQERGEESFLIERLTDGSVRGVVAVDAEPATRAARLVGPAVRRFSQIAVARYLTGLRKFVERSSG